MEIHIQSLDRKGMVKLVDLIQLRRHILICNGATCLRNGGDQVAKTIREEIKKHNIEKQIHTTLTRCNGQCKNGPIVIEYPQGNWYGFVDEAVATHLVISIQNRELCKNNLIYSICDNE